MHSDSYSYVANSSQCIQRSSRSQASVESGVRAQPSASENTRKPVATTDTTLEYYVVCIICI